MISDKYKLLLKMNDTFQGFIKDTRYFSMTDNLEEREVETYYPVVYPEFFVRRQFENIKDELDKKLKKAEAELAKNPLNKGAIAKVANLSQRLKSINKTLGSLENAIIDESTGEKLIFQSTSKHYISYTGALEIMNMRTDKGVYYDYLKYNFSQIERNILTAKLIEQLGETNNESVHDYLFDYYSVPFNNKSLKTRLGLFNIDPTGETSTVPLISKILSPETQDRLTRHIGAFLTWGYLGHFMTGAVNMTALAQNIYKTSFKETMDSLTKWLNLGKKDSESDKALTAIIKRSGIIDFGEFFGEAMVERLAGVALEHTTQIKILDIMIKYADLLTGNPGKTTELTAEMHSEIAQMLDDSKRFFEQYNPDLPIDETKLKEKKEQLKKERRLTYQSKRDTIASAFVQYAINKRAPIFNHMRVILKEHSLIGGPVRKAWLAFKKSGIGFYSAIAPLLRGLAMGTTEQTVRIVPFIIALERAIKNGELPNKGFQKYTEAEVKKAINIGKNASDRTNYSLSTTGLGPSFWGSWGRVLSKFVGWSNQKWQDDYSVLNDLYRFYAKEEKLGKMVFIEGITEGKGKEDIELAGIEDVGIDKLAILKVFRDLYTLPFTLPLNLISGKTKVKNMKDYTAREAYKFILMQGATTLLTDIVFFGAFRGAKGYIKAARQIFSGTPTGVSRVAGGASSDLLSMLYFPLVLALTMSAGGSDDEEEVNNILQYYWRRLPLGFGIKYGVDLLMSFLNSFEYNGEFKDFRESALKPVYKAADPTGLINAGKIVNELEDIILEE